MPLSDRGKSARSSRLSSDNPVTAAAAEMMRKGARFLTPRLADHRGIRAQLGGGNVHGSTWSWAKSCSWRFLRRGGRALPKASPFRRAVRADIKLADFTGRGLSAARRRRELPIFHLASRRGRRKSQLRGNLTDQLYRAGKGGGLIVVSRGHHPTTVLFWLGLGLLGQLLFTGRMVVQWIASERKGIEHCTADVLVDEPWRLAAAAGVFSVAARSDRAAGAGVRVVHLSAEHHLDLEGKRLSPIGSVAGAEPATRG